MANFGNYPQTVNFQTVNVSAGGGSENLLINPRGKINQAGEASGVLSAGAYFCDGWKAGAAGAEVYIDDDGFRLISGSILQLVPNNLEVGRTIRGNMDVISGAPVISINSGSDNVLSDTAEYIQFEISGDNSKFTRLILAESVSLPIYLQSLDELPPCKRTFIVSDLKIRPAVWQKGSGYIHDKGVETVAFEVEMLNKPSIALIKDTGSKASVTDLRKKGFSLYDCYTTNNGGCAIVAYTADARP